MGECAPSNLMLAASTSHMLWRSGLVVEPAREVRSNRSGFMNQVTQLLKAVERGEQQAAEQLLPLVYEELRKIARAKMLHELPGQTLQATALVHEAYLRLVGTAREDVDDPLWDGRGHFFAAAAEAMRRVLVDNALRKKSLKRGGDQRRLDVAEVDPAMPAPREDLLALNDALDALAAIQPQTAELVKLRYFTGLTNKQAAELLGISPRKADSLWAYARVWLHDRIVGDQH